MGVPKYKDPEYHKKYYQKNKEKIKSYLKSYLANQLPNDRWQGRNQIYRLYHSVKQGAKRKNLEFTITMEDIKIPETCPYMGWPITNLYGCGRVRTNASIDRIDPSKGYTPDNIMIISDFANTMKQNATPEELLLFAEGIKRIHGTQIDTSQST